MSNENKSTKENKWISDGIIIAAFPAFSYAIAYAFESGVTEYYGIPNQLIEISLPGTFIALGYLLSALFSVWMMAEALNPLWRKLPDPIRKRLRLYSGFIVFIFGYALIAGEKLSKLKFLWIILGVMLFFDFILPALAFRDARSYAERIKHIHDQDLRYDSVLDKIAARIGVSWILVAMIIITVLTFSYYAGIGYAQRKTEYLTESKDDVILRQYSDIIISAPINRATRRISRVYSVRKLSAEKTITIKPEIIGPLTIEKDVDGTKPFSTDEHNKEVKPNNALKRGAVKNRRDP